MDDGIREALRDLLGANVVEVHDLRPEARVRKIWRVRTAGHHESVIVRAVVSDHDRTDEAWAMVERDASALEAAAASGVVPDLISRDPERRIVVMEDLGAGPSLADLLLGDDATAAASGLVSMAVTLGRLHASTRAEGPVDVGIHMTSDTQKRAVDLIEALHGLDISVPDAALDDIATAVDELSRPGAATALVHGDPCPDNNVVRPDGSVVLFDFDWASRGSALLDAAYLHLPFPSCWCANAIPQPVVDEAEVAYRVHFDISDSDYAGGLAAAAVAWCVTTFAWAMPRLGDNDRRWGISMHTPRCFTRLRTARALCESAGLFTGFIGLATNVEKALAPRWPDAAGGLPLYPAFR